MASLIVLCLAVTLLLVIWGGRGPRPGGKVAMCPPPGPRSQPLPPPPPTWKAFA